MKTYYIGTNNYWHTASISFDEVPTILYYLENIVSWICSIFPEIPLPKIKFKLKYNDDWCWSPNEDGWTTLRDWFGDTQALFHIYVCTPVHNLAEKYTKTIMINLPYNFVKEKFPIDFKEKEYTSEWGEDENEFREKTKKLANWTDDLFRDVYRKLDFEYIKESVK